MGAPGVGEAISPSFATQLLAAAVFTTAMYMAKFVAEKDL